MGELKECEVHSVEQLAERHILSLATQRVQEAQEKGKPAEISFTSANRYVASPHNRYEAAQLYLHCLKGSATLAPN